MGHNYKKHFGELTNLQPGNEVTLQTMDGQEYYYQVATLETLTSTATKEMTAGDYPLTLFTCDYSGQARIAVRCQQKSITKTSGRSGVSVRLAACLVGGRDILKNST